MEKRLNDTPKCSLCSLLGLILCFPPFLLFAYLYFLKFCNEHALLSQKKENRDFQLRLLKWTDSQAAYGESKPTAI